MPVRKVDEDGYLNLPHAARLRLWNVGRPYKHVRLWLKDAPFIPKLIKPFLRGSVLVESILTWLAGPDELKEGDDV